MEESENQQYPGEKEQNKKDLQQLPYPGLTMMGKGIQSTAQAQEMGRKGGSVTGPTKSLGQKIRWLKKKGMCEENAQWLYDVIKNKELCYLEIASMIKEMYMKASNVDEINLVVKNMIQLSKQVHGQKIEVAGDIHKEIDNSINISIEMWQPDGKKEDTNSLQSASQTIDISPEPKKV